MASEQKKTLPQNKFYELLNERVFRPHLGRDLTFDEAKNIVHGISDVIFEVVHGGQDLRFGRLGTFKPHTMPPGMQMNPKTRERFFRGELRKLVFKQSKSTKRLFSISDLQQTDLEEDHQL